MLVIAPSLVAAASELPSAQMTRPRTAPEVSNQVQYTEIARDEGPDRSIGEPVARHRTVRRQTAARACSAWEPGRPPDCPRPMIITVPAPLTAYPTLPVRRRRRAGVAPVVGDRHRSEGAEVVDSSGPGWSPRWVRYGIPTEDPPRAAHEHPAGPSTATFTRALVAQRRHARGPPRSRVEPINGALSAHHVSRAPSWLKAAPRWIKFQTHRRTLSTVRRCDDDAVRRGQGHEAVRAIDRGRRHLVRRGATCQPGSAVEVDRVDRAVTSHGLEPSRRVRRPHGHVPGGTVVDEAAPCRTTQLVTRPAAARSPRPGHLRPTRPGYTLPIDRRRATRSSPDDTSSRWTSAPIPTATVWPSGATATGPGVRPLPTIAPTRRSAWSPRPVRCRPSPLQR